MKTLLLILTLFSLPAFTQTEKDIEKVFELKTPFGLEHFFVDKRIKRDGNKVEFDAVKSRIIAGKVDKTHSTLTTFRATCDTYQYAFIHTKGFIQGKFIDEDWPENLQDAPENSPIRAAIDLACGLPVKGLEKPKAIVGKGSSYPQTK
jgi:hypothetical protein